MLHWVNNMVADCWLRWDHSPALQQDSSPVSGDFPGVLQVMDFLCGSRFPSCSWVEPVPLQWLGIFKVVNVRKMPSLSTTLSYRLSTFPFRLWKWLAWWTGRGVGSQWVTDVGFLWKEELWPFCDAGKSKFWLSPEIQRGLIQRTVDMLERFCWRCTTFSFC